MYRRVAGALRRFEELCQNMPKRGYFAPPLPASTFPIPIYLPIQRALRAFYDFHKSYFANSNH
jgi:hypothetical protein